MVFIHHVEAKRLPGITMPVNEDSTTTTKQYKGNPKHIN